MNKTYAMMLSTTDDLFQEEIWTTLSDHIEDYDDRIFFFCGKPIHSTLDDESYSNIVFNLMHYLTMDGLISLTGSLNHYIGTDAYKQYINQFGDVHKVSISVPLEGCSNVVLDNYGSSFALCSHLVEHGYKRFGIITGPERTSESSSRYRGTCDALFLNHLEAPVYINGDFSKHSGYVGAQALIKSRIDVIICANDQMALGAYDAAFEMGLRVPEDIAITGFDDIEQASLLKVPLTTVKQPFGEMVKSAYQILRTGKLTQLDHMGELKIRESCGCAPEILDASSEHERMNYYMNRYHESIQDYTETVSLHNKFDMVDDHIKLKSVISEYLSKMPHPEFHLCLFEDHKKAVENPLDFKYPEAMIYKYGLVEGHVQPETTFKMQDAFSEKLLPKTHHKSLLVYPITLHHQTFGYMIADSGTARKKTFPAFRGEVANALNRIDMFEQIKAYNKQLADIASSDVMTGLLNRRGFFEVIHQNYDKHIKNKKTPEIIYSDVNGLKMVNDSFGHAVGDELIIDAARILKSVFSEDYVARIGGDEFIIYRQNSCIEERESLFKKLEYEIKHHNENSQKPYTLAIEAGAACYCPEKNHSVEELISEADNMLYVKKKIAKTCF